LGDKYFIIFPFIAGLVLLLALVNYISLTTARSTLRAKEIGVRKVLGAGRGNVIAQFYVETILSTLPAFLISFLICYLFGQKFYENLDIKIDSGYIFNGWLLIQFLALFCLTVLLAGGYPALILSWFKPTETIKGKMSKKGISVVIRKSFTVLQFGISIGLIICGIVIRNQINFIRQVNTGINRKNVVMIPLSNSFGKNYNRFKRSVESLSGVKNVATSEYEMYGGVDMLFAANKLTGQNVGVSVLSVDTNFLSLMQIKWKTPPLSNAILTNKDKIVVNEEAISRLGLSASNTVGESINNGNTKLQVIGIQDFDISALQSGIKPIAMVFSDDTTQNWSTLGGVMFVKLNTNADGHLTISKIKDLFDSYGQQEVFNYVFLDDVFDNQYADENRLANIFKLFSILSLFLALVGLYALSTFVVEQRKKEIGIRKVLGASLYNIFKLVTIDFLVLILISALVSSPISFLFMHAWLQNFYYRMGISLWIFLASNVLVCFVAMVTIGYQIIKIASNNPINSLRTE
jgi:putative ABC transport system permease protein